MIKTLVKKQILQIFYWVFADRKTGKVRSGKKLLGFVVLYAFLFGYLGLMFYYLADFLCEPFVVSGLGWFYFTFMGLLGVVVGVFGSVFSTYASLYKPKDNDFLLSMPIKPSAILISRLIGVYLTGLLYELIAMVPAVIVWYIYAKPNVLGIIFTALIPVILSLLVLALSCILGFVVALISSRLKNKNVVIMVASLGFIALYYYGYSKIYNLLQELITNPQILDDGVKNILYPFYKMGLAASGEVVSMLIFTSIVVGILAVVCFVMSRSFIKVATINNGDVKRVYKGNREKSGNIKTALFKKELRRFLGSPTYMLNCGIGCVMTLVVAVFVAIKQDMINEILSLFAFENKEAAWLITAAALAGLGSTNNISAPSVSLEGKHLWIIKMLPVPAKEVLYAKLKLHLAIALLPILVMSVTVSVITKMSFVFATLTILLAVVMTFFIAVLGLVLNVKFPNFDWHNETVPVKQSASVTLTLFGGWTIVLGFGLLYYFLLKDFVSPAVFLALCLFVLALVSMALFLWISKKGAEVFSKF